MTKDKGNKEIKRPGKPGKVRKGNYYPENPLTNVAIMEMQYKAIRYFGINYTSLLDLITIYNNFIETNTGINPNRILKAYKRTDGNFRVLFYRLESLKNKGLIYNTDRLYYPTEKTLKEIPALSQLLRSAS